MKTQNNGVALLKTLVITAFSFSLTACDQATVIESKAVENAESEIVQNETLILHFIDHTVVGSDDGQYRVNSSDISALSGMDMERTNGVEYMGIPINNLTLNPVFPCKLAAENSLLNNEIERKEQVQNFQDSLAKTLDKVYPTNDSCYKSTSLFLPFARRLSNYHNDQRKKVVIIQSDLLENTTQLSLVKSGYLLRDTERLKLKLEKIHPLPNMQGIEVIFLFQPKAENNELFESSVKFFTEWFRERGATTSIRVNL